MDWYVNNIHWILPLLSMCGFVGGVRLATAYYRLIGREPVNAPRGDG